jgi:hypothetical protein
MLELALHLSTAATKPAWRLTPLHYFLLNLFAVLLAPAIASAQTASLRGQVVDQSGAVIPEASVTLTAPSGLVRKTATAESGFYSFAGLPPVSTPFRQLQNWNKNPFSSFSSRAPKLWRLELKIGCCAAADLGSGQRKHIRHHGIGEQSLSDRHQRKGFRVVSR